MSKLLEQIKADQLQARKDRDTCTTTALTTLIGEASPSGNETVTDQQVQGIVKKFIKNLDELVKYTKDANTQYSILNEIALYKSYLPKQIEGNALETLITDLICCDGCDNLGKVMKALNGGFGGQFNGKEASVIAKRLL